MAIYNMITYGGGSTPTPTPSVSKMRKDVNFFDYDGTIVESYTAQEWASVTSLPANPSHDGLVAQGWNYTLSQINTEVSAQGKCNVGQMYVTESGASEIDIHIADIARNNPYLGIAVNGTAVIDWGDGSSTNTVAGTSLDTQIRTQHTYSAVGDYTIKIMVSTGNMAFYGTSAYLLLGNNSTRNNSSVFSNMVQAVRIGANTSIDNYAFGYCYSLASVTIPSGVTSIGSSAFSNCYSLASVTIPNGVTSIGTNAFSNCYSLASVTIPSGVTIIDSYAFSACYSLASITIPSGVTNIGGNAFSACSSLASITIPNSVTSIGSGAFSGCASLASVTISSGVRTLITNAFSNCYSLASVTIPSGVTSIGSSAFSNCYSLASVTIPNGVTSIAASAFNNCYGMKIYHIKPTTPPTLANTNAFNNIPSDCKFYVPSESLSAYQAASNWSSYASRMIGE